MSETANVCDIVIFGGHGDLSLRKLIPALYHLYNDGYLSVDSRIIATSRTDVSREEHLALVKEKLQLFLKPGCFEEAKWEAFSRQLEVVTVDLGIEESYGALAKMLGDYPQRDRINYLSTAPTFFGPVCKALSRWEMITPKSRVVLEKPIGRDLASSKEINDEVARYFEEQATFRIDHYLGKDTVQNIIALRFSNMLFMQLWNNQDIDHIQITAAESVGLEGRHSYYEDYGALRDMIQNHLMQLLCLVAMEPPCSLEADSIRDEKVKVLRSCGRSRRTMCATKRSVAATRRGSSARRRCRDIWKRESRPNPIPRRSRPYASTWTTGAGRGCPSIFVPASG